MGSWPSRAEPVTIRAFPSLLNWLKSGTANIRAFYSYVVDILLTNAK
jgi:hypothetical protein